MTKNVFDPRLYFTRYKLVQKRCGEVGYIIITLLQIIRKSASEKSLKIGHN